MKLIKINNSADAGSQNQTQSQGIDFNEFSMSNGGFTESADDRDPLFADAGRFIVEKEKASIGMLQRVFKIGFNRAARIMDQLEEAGVVGPEMGTKPRTVNIQSVEEFENIING